MSHYTQVATSLRDQAALVAALKEMGLDVESHSVPQHLLGYQGDIRPEIAEVIVRRKFVGRASNDIGFVRGKDGTFRAIVSEYDRKKYGEAWLGQVNVRYSRKIAVAKMTAQGLRLAEDEERPDGSHLLVFTRGGR
jgi:hypothetical protein